MNLSMYFLYYYCHQIESQDCNFNKNRVRIIMTFRQQNCKGLFPTVSRSSALIELLSRLKNYNAYHSVLIFLHHYSNYIFTVSLLIFCVQITLFLSFISTYNFPNRQVELFLIVLLVKVTEDVLIIKYLFDTLN